MAQRAGLDDVADKPDEMAVRVLRLASELAAEIHPHHAPGPAITLDSSLDRDLGLDSLARVELLMRIEREFGVSLPERAFADAETPRDLFRSLLSAHPRGVSPGPSGSSKLVLGEAEAAPHSAQTLVEVLEWHVQAHPDRPHIQLYADEDEGDVITYRQLRTGARSVAVGLQQRGLQLGEPVAIMLPTGQDYFFSFYGILLAGGIPVPIYPPVRVTQIEDHLRRHAAILANCRAAILITVPEAKPLARLLKAQATSLRSIETAKSLSSEAGLFNQPALGANDIAFLQYTSGSTGNPKGVVLTHANLLANIRTMGDAVRADPTDVFISWLPLYHDMGLIGAWLGSLYYTVLLVIMSPLAFLTRPQRWLWAIHRYQGSLSAAPNFAYELCMRKVNEEDIQGLDLGSLRIAFNGAEPVSPDTVERFCGYFGKYGFHRGAMMPVYGLAESSVGLAFPPLYRGPVIGRIQRDTFMRSGRAVPAEETDTKALRFVACGRPLPEHQIRVVDKADRELPECREGRLQFRGPSVTSGYFHNPEQTRRLFHGDWLDSGDLAYIADGEVYITGRTKDIIIRAGRNIYPHELEEALGDIARIRKGCVAVFGSRDTESTTERLVILAETREKDPEILQQLRTEINAVTLDLIGTPADDIVLAPPHTVLKTSSGKLRRAASRELYERGQIGQTRRAVYWQVTRLLFSGLAPQARRAAGAAAAAAYAGYAWLLFGMLAPVAWTAVAVLPRESWRWPVIRVAARLLARASGTRLTVHGLDNLPPSDRPCVFVVNHASYLDGAVVVASLPRTFSFVAKAELTQSLISRVFLSRLRAEFVERFEKQKGIIDARRVARAASDGRPLMFFPEGTFTRMPGLLPFYMGAFVAAVEAGVPVVPIAIRGTRSILRAYSWFPRHGAITVTIGKPIGPQDLEAPPAADAWTTALRLREAAREQILSYCGEPDLAEERSI